MKQAYHNYSTQEHQIWQTLFERQMAQLPRMASQVYLNGIDKAGFVAQHIPNFEEEINPRLKALTGWKIIPVAGLIPVKEFFELLAEKKFPAATWIRDTAHLEYLEEPDLFHDTFGHIPLLTDQHFCNFLSEFSKICLKYIQNEWAITLLQRLYWFTVEFGLIQEKGELKIYGGGILSSDGESNYSLYSPFPTRDPYQVKEVMSTVVKIDEFQKKYFVIDSFEALYQSIPTIEKTVAAELELIS